MHEAESLKDTSVGYAALILVEALFVSLSTQGMPIGYIQEIFEERTESLRTEARLNRSKNEERTAAFFEHIADTLSDTWQNILAANQEDSEATPPS